MRQDALVVLYDSTCPFCAWCRTRLEALTPHVTLTFVCARSNAARASYGRLPLAHALVVVDALGRAWVGPDAFVMCLWAREETHGLANALACEELRWLAQHAFTLVSAHRDWLARWVGVECHGECSLHEHASAPYR